MLRAFFTATVVIEFEETDDDVEAARDALNDYIAEHDISENFELERIEDHDEPA